MFVNCYILFVDFYCQLSLRLLPESLLHEINTSATEILSELYNILSTVVEKF